MASIATPTSTFHSISNLDPISTPNHTNIYKERHTIDIPSETNESRAEKSRHLFGGADSHNDLKHAALERQLTAQTEALQDIVSKFNAPKTSLGQPGPTGLTCFAVTLFTYGCWTTGFLPAATSNIVLPMALWSAGVALFVAGCFELANSNTFGATAFIAYSTFYLAFTTLAEFVMPGWTSAGVPVYQQNQALGMYFMIWTFITLYFTIAAIRTSVAVLAIFVVLFFCFFFFSAAYYYGSDSGYDVDTFQGLLRTGGWLAIVTAILGLFTAGFTLINLTWNADVLPLGVIGPLQRKPATDVGRRGSRVHHRD